MAQQFGDSNIGDFYQRPARPAASPSMTPMGDMGFQTPTKVGNNWGTPNSGALGGGVPGGGFYGRPAENGPTLSPNLLGRYAPTERFNYLEILGNNAGTQLGWVSIVVERPTLLIPVEQLFGSVYYAPHAIPTTFGSGSALLNAERAEGPGVVYLWAPGTWWIKYNTAATVPGKFRQVSAEDPAIVAAAMSMPGSQRINSYNVNLNTGPTTTLLADANPARRAIVIQAKTSGITTTNPLYIGLNTVAPTSSLFAFALTSQFQSVTFSDEAMNTGVIYGVCAAVGQTCQVTEYE